MLIPAVVLCIIFSYIPMVGILIAFQDYNPFRGFFRSDFIGWSNFRFLMSMPNIWRVLFNTVFIAVMKIIAGTVAPITFALLLNEVRVSGLKRTIQTIVYMPNFLSWVILGSILVDILSPGDGVVNSVIKALGGDPVFFLGDPKIFPYVIVISDVWKGFGFGAIVYLAAISSVNPNLYEAAIIDGATRLKRVFYITIPCIAPTIILLATLSLGSILNAGFDQIFNLYAPITYETGDIIDTFVYRLGLVSMQYGPAAAVGFFKSAVSCTLIVLSYYLARRLAGYTIF